MSDDPTAAMRRAITTYENVTNFFTGRGIESTVTMTESPQSVVRTGKTLSRMNLWWTLDVTRLDNFEFTLCVGECLIDPIGTLHYTSVADQWEILVQERKTGPRLGFERRDHIRMSGEEIRRNLERVYDFILAHRPPYNP